MKGAFPVRPVSPEHGSGSGIFISPKNVNVEERDGKFSRSHQSSTLFGLPIVMKEDMKDIAEPVIFGDFQEYIVPRKFIKSIKYNEKDSGKKSPK